ncbi:MAG: BMP family ABC transporter substrate-binding protein [Leptolyngbyaceae cyanobacterium RU_5_1]|nr:BMP family ABC transporter substrate-binding protein [Leptolyngbyaceae cyanobacterium RU_5_1]
MTENLNRRQFLVYSSAAFSTSLFLKACTNPLTLGGGSSSSTGGKVKVAGVYTVPVRQQWVSRIHTALNAAKKRGDIKYDFSEKITNAGYEQTLRRYAETGNQLIVGEAFGVETACRTVARDYPNVSFLMGSSGKPDGDNFAVFDNYIHEASYLTGLIAGGMTQSNIIGLVGGYPIPEVNRLMNAFMRGVEEIAPEVKFLISFIGSWYDPSKARETALSQIEAGADVMYAERFGVSEVAQKKKVLAIGSVIDTQKDYPDTVIASALWHMEPTIDRAIQAVRAGTFNAKDYGQYSYMKYNGCSLAPYGTFESKIPAALKQKVKQHQDDILSGKLLVKIDDAEPKSTA